MVCCICDIITAAGMLIIGLLFYRSDGKGVNFLSGYEGHNGSFTDAELCRLYGKKIMLMAVPFVLGAVADLFIEGVGIVLAWVVWIAMFIMLTITRTKIEKP